MSLLTFNVIVFSCHFYFSCGIVRDQLRGNTHSFLFSPYWPAKGRILCLYVHKKRGYYAPAGFCDGEIVGILGSLCWTSALGSSRSHKPGRLLASIKLLTVFTQPLDKLPGVTIPCSFYRMVKVQKQGLAWKVVHDTSARVSQNFGRVDFCLWDREDGGLFRTHLCTSHFLFNY